jgi:hypothetical protein
MPTDDEKAKWSGNRNGRAWAINYYDCWHCKRCGSELKRVCAVCLLEKCDNDNIFWCDIEEGTIQICPFGCSKIGGLDMFHNKVKPKPQNH